eukprot:2689293-Amphidinium_carterae.1
MVNQHANRSGYSAIQRVLGYMPQLPVDLMRDSEHPALGVEGPLEAVRRSERIRSIALEAWAKMSSRQRLLTSLRSRNRGAPYDYTVGERVWVWRKPLAGRGPAWYGPGTIVALTPSGAFVSLRGSLWKVSGQCLRPQQAEDRIADEMVARYLHALRTDLSTEGVRTQRRYVECTREPGPTAEVEPPGLGGESTAVEVAEEPREIPQPMEGASAPIDEEVQIEAESQSV